MPDTVLEFQPISTPDVPATNDTGQPAISATAIAAAAAAEAVRGSAAAPPGSRFDSTVSHGGDHAAAALPSDESKHAEFQTITPKPEAIPAVPAVPAVPDEPVMPIVATPTPEVTPEVKWPATALYTQAEYKELQDSGIDLPIAPNEVPVGFETAYAQLAQAVVDSHHAADEKTLDAQTALLQVKEFADKLKTSEGQQRLLIGLSMNNPESFSSAMEIVTRMQDDTEYAEVVKARLEADLTLEQAKRERLAFDTTRSESRGRQVASRTDRLARSLGLDATLAKQHVKARILENQAAGHGLNISLTEVDVTLQDLARLTGATPPVRTPEAQRVVEQAPQTPAAGVGHTPPAPEPLSAARRVQQPQDARDALRGAIAASAARIREGTPR